MTDPDAVPARSLLDK